MDDPERNTSLGIFYDDLLRKEVENKCGQLGASWDFTQMFLKVDEGVLRKARRFVGFFSLRASCLMCVFLQGV